MKYTDLVTYVRDKTGTDSVTFPLTTMAIYYNIAKDEVARAISRADESYFGISMLHNLVAGQRNYSFEDSMLTNMYRLEGNIAPTDDEDDWKVLKEYNLNQFASTTDEDSLVAYMANYPNGYIIFGGELKIVSADPIIDVTDGLKLWCNVFPSDIESTDLESSNDISEPPSTVEFGMPKQFHELIARRMVIEYKEAQDKPIPLTQKEELYYNDLKNAVNQISNQNFDRNFTANKPYNDGSAY
jgi:hypothetical protein